MKQLAIVLLVCVSVAQADDSTGFKPPGNDMQVMSFQLEANSTYLPPAKIMPPYECGANAVFYQVGFTAQRSLDPLSSQCVVLEGASYQVNPVAK